MEDYVFPQSYEEWRQSITVQGGIELTPEYISERVTSLKNESDPSTQKFIKLYGQQYHQQVLGWFVQAQKNGR